MITDSDIIASFSPDAQSFAFRPNGLQRKYVDLYPLSEANDYKVTSSLVSHIDYESGDLKLEELKFFTWCTSPANDRSTASKRRNSHSDSADKELVSAAPESYFVNVFSGGNIVVFSPTGKEILNIIHNKREILGLDSLGSTIWIVDDEKTVKQFDYKSSKPIKTFHLVDGKDEDITQFQILSFQGKTLLAVFTETHLYVVDPSKRRPSTVLAMNVRRGRCCVAGRDNQIVFAGAKEINVVDLKSGTVFSKWAYEASQLRFWADKIYALSVEGDITVFSASDSKIVSNVKCQRSNIINFTFVQSNVIIAWLKINEPRFERIPFQSISESKTITFKQEGDEESNDLKEESSAEAAPAAAKNAKGKVPKAEQKDIAATLLNLLDGKALPAAIEECLASENWTEAHIKETVVSSLSEEQIQTIFNLVSGRIANDPWSIEQNLVLWFKWLLTFSRGQLINGHDHHASKRLRQVKSSLRASSEVYSQLLAMKGKLA